MSSPLNPVAPRRTFHQAASSEGFAVWPCWKNFFIILLTSRSVFIAVDIKKGKAGSLPFFQMLAPALSASSTGTAFSLPFGRTFSALLRASRG